MREKKYETRVPITMNVDNGILQAFKEMCRKDRLSVSERVNAFMTEEVKKEEALANPIAIAYGSCNSTVDNTEPLDLYIKLGQISHKHWKDFYDKKGDYEQVIRYEALGSVIKDEGHFRATNLKAGNKYREMHPLISRPFGLKS